MASNNSNHSSGASGKYDGPAGFVLSHDECELLWRETVHVTSVQMFHLRSRMRRYLDSDWQEMAERRARAVDGR